MKKFRSVVSATLITFDAPIAADERLLTKLKLEPDGWKLVTSKEIQSFLKAFKKSFRVDLETYMVKSSEKLRLGGSVFTTMVKLLELRPQIEKGAAFVPVGRVEGKKGQIKSLVSTVNKKRLSLISDLTKSLGGRILVSDSSGSGITPIILSFYQDKGRSMVLIRDEQTVKASLEITRGLIGQTLVLVDARELRQKGFREAITKLVKRPKTFAVIGLGAASVLPDTIFEIKNLLRHTKGEVGFSGNRSETEILVDHWGGVKNLSDLMIKTDIKFLLETDGQNGATLYTKGRNRINSVTYILPKEEVFGGDTTNAGDVFLAWVLSGLIDGRSPYQTLDAASKGTLKYLKERA